MGLLERGVDALGSQAAKLGERGVEAAVKRGRELLIPAMPAELAPVVETVAARLEAKKSVVGLVSGQAVRDITGYLALGLEDDARSRFLAEVASFRERQDALLGAGAAALDEHDAREKAWAELRSTLLEILLAAGKAAIPILLAMI